MIAYLKKTYNSLELNFYFFIDSCYKFFNWLKNPKQALTDIKNYIYSIPSKLKNLSIKMGLWILSLFKGTLDPKDLLDISNPDPTADSRLRRDTQMHINSDSEAEYTEMDDREESHQRFPNSTPSLKFSRKTSFNDFDCGNTDGCGL